MRPIATYVLRSVVCLGTTNSCARTAEPIEMVFRMEAVGPKNNVLDRGPDWPTGRGTFEGDDFGLPRFSRTLSDYCVSVTSADTRRHPRSANCQLLAVGLLHFRLNTSAVETFQLQVP